MYTTTIPSAIWSKFICFACLSLSFLFLNAQELAPDTETKLIHHLTEINKLWATYGKDIDGLNNRVSFNNDEERIQMHFLVLIKHLEEKNVSQLNTAQKTKRLQHLAELKKYALQAKFPQNAFHPCRQPYFIDQNNTHCAVAHLIKESGHASLVTHIRSANNYAYVKELVATYPELGRWAKLNGLTIEELSLIQPGYAGPPPDQFVFQVGNGGGTDGHINVMETSPGGGRLYMAGNFTNVDGINANSIITWDGTEWYTLGEGVDGEIFDLHWHNDRLHIAGNFRLHGEEEYTNIAYWNNVEWIPLQQGESGNIYVMTTYKNQLHIGGAFQHLNENDMPFLAFYHEASMTWMNHSWIIDGDNLINAPNVFSVDDTVRCFTIYEEILYIGGDFLATAPYADYSIFQKTVGRYAKWQGTSWLEETTSNFDQINEIIISDSFLIFTGVYENIACRANDYQLDSGPNIMFYYWPLNENLPSSIQGYFKFDNKTYFYGNIFTQTALFFFEGVIPISGYDGGIFNDYIRSATVFQNNIYFAGAFTEAFDEPLNGLAYSAWGGNTVSTHTINHSKSIKVYSGNNQLKVEYENLQLPSTLLVYNIKGQLLKSLALSTGMNQLSIDINEWPTGAYAYQVVNSASRSGGKFFVQ